MRARMLNTTVALASLALAEPASATVTEIVGGPGGSSFTLRCAPNQQVVGFHANAGAWVDGFALLCAPPGSRNRRQVGWAGGNSGSPQEVYCSTALPGTGIFMTFTHGQGLRREYVNGMGMTCGPERPVCISTGEGCAGRLARALIPGLTGSDPEDPDRLECPSDEVLIGVTGRSGTAVDALGAICGPAPAPIVMLPYIPKQRLPKAGSETSPVKSDRVLLPTSKLPPVGSTGPSKLERPILLPLPKPSGDTCGSGYVWRETSSDDHVCVTPDSRERVQVENRLADMRRDPAGAYGPMSCKTGFVWREASDGDVVCVEPEIRSLVKKENAEAADHRL